MEYTRFGEGWISRAEPEDDWTPIAEADVPGEVKDTIAIVEARKANVAKFGFDPLDPPQAGIQITRADGTVEQKRIGL